MHEHEQDRADKPTRQQAPLSTNAPAEASSGLRAIRGLQRSIGNAAVAQLLDSAEQVEQEETHESSTGVHEVLSGSGQPLANGVRSDMESRLGADFSSVRVHNDSAAADSADRIGARAYTSGEHVVLGRGGGDDHTLAHELWHVVQQRQGPVSATPAGDGLALSDPGDQYERAAEDMATKAMSAPATDHSGHNHAGPDHSAHDHAGPAAHSHDAAPVQRSPRDWRQSDTVRDALGEDPGGMGLRQSFWPPITRAIRAYISIQDNTQLTQRGDILTALEQAVQAWQNNQAQATTISINNARAQNKRAIIAQLVQMIATERAEIQSASAPQRPAATPAIPMGIPGSSAQPMGIGGPARTRPGQQGESSSDDETLDLSALRGRFGAVANLPAGIDIHAHLTGRRAIPPIHAQGLVPGAGRGIGLPDTDGQPDNQFVYLLSGSPDAARFVGQEAGGHAVGVISSGAPIGPDTNYQGGAYMHHGQIPPARGAGGGGATGPFSFTLPATPTTRQGLRDFVNGHLPQGQQPLSEAEVLERVLAALWRQFGIRVAGDLSRS
ncbi:DUF4157 domain-containing protein [Actinokineospora inagensis]|uniref:eCIS core domain-containing protein n=1 Tax=Actinokineospora inagensis TaxID=103730 RepID=UPI0004106636|nr:DUF4157 domain-containing protein [Actinokineospora inagensis]